MNLKQQRFAEYYHECGNASLSAERAGYSPKTAYSQGQRLLKNVEVSAYIQELSQQDQNERIISSVQRQELLSDIARNEGNTPTERIRAIDTLNKMTGEYTVRSDLNTDTDLNVTIDYGEKLSDIFAQLSTGELKPLAGLED